ncbi:MAG: hydrogenase accessory protein HypB, partial [Candidatus Hydrogenedentes bacterium]|nr:hydrogenase accessory protein HypB [Candidatus Hydrogenedentota bacterium]
GHDKPLKYPKAFRSADTMVITKSDLIPYTNFDLDEAKTFALQINPDLHIVETSCTTGAGIDEWANWISDLCAQNQTES